MLATLFLLVFLQSSFKCLSVSLRVQSGEHDYSVSVGAAESQGLFEGGQL